MDIYAIGKTIETLYTGKDLHIAQMITKMTSPSPLDRGDILYWCDVFKVRPCTMLTFDAPTAKSLYPDIFTDEKLTNGKLELELCQGSMVNKQVSLSLSLSLTRRFVFR